MAKQDFTVLVIKAQQGDPNALSDLMAQSYETLYYYAYNCVKNPDLAADITQESCIEIMDTLSKLRDPSAFRTWSGRIVYHQCTRYFKQSVEVPFPEDEAGESILDQLPDESRGSLPEQVQEDKEFQKTILDMLDSLPAEQRTALMLYYYENLSVGQIAQIQETTEGTVKSRLNYGRKAVKSQVENYEKKTGIRLHSIAILPLLLYFLFRQNSATALKNVDPTLSNIHASISNTASIAAPGATVATAKAAGISLTAKIIAGITAVVIATGAVTGAVLLSNSPDSPVSPIIGTTQYMGNITTSQPEQTTPAATMPAAPQDPLSQSAYYEAYLQLPDVTDLIHINLTGLPSTTTCGEAFVTEVSSKEELETLASQYDSAGYTESDQLYWEEVPENSRYFLLGNPNYSSQLMPKLDSARYDEATGTVYFLIENTQHDYADREPQERYEKDVMNNATAAYYFVSTALTESFPGSVCNMVFVAPEEKPVTRTDIPVTIVPYDPKYQQLEFFDYSNSGMHASSYTFPSTVVPAGKEITFINDLAQFQELQSTYNDIINRDEDAVIMEAGVVKHIHRTNGLSNTSSTGLINILVSSPELDAQSSMRCESFFIPIENDKTYLCGIFYDAKTATAYIHLGYNGMPHTQYEAWRDEAAIEETSRATYVMMSIGVHEDCTRPIENIAIVLPDPMTIPEF